MRRSGFSLIEVLIAIFILGIGAISIAALFPAGIIQQRASVDDTMGPVVADNAMSLLRARLQQGDFGTFEAFAGIDTADIPLSTVPGDWPWMRPGFLLADDPATLDGAGGPYDERGAYDVFSYRFTRGDSIAAATELPDGMPPNDITGEPRLFGIPYNRARYDFQSSTFLPEPRFIITQRERYYPMATEEAVVGQKPPLPLFVWDCMFRRFQGRILVAVFVYRVKLPASGNVARYVTPPNPLNVQATSPPGIAYPPLPYRLDLRTANPPPWPMTVPSPWTTAWDAWGLTPNTGPSDVADDAQVPGTLSGTVWEPRDPAASWQQPDQWLLDQNNVVHRVLFREAETAGDNAIVELLHPVLPVSDFDFRVSYFDPAPASGPAGVENVVTHVWYIPTEVHLDLTGDGTPDESAPSR